MRKRQATKKRALKRAAKDRTLEEFEKSDLGNDIEAAGTARVIRPQVMTSIRLDADLMQRLKKRAAALGIGYQTLLKMIVKKNVDGEL